MNLLERMVRNRLAKNFSIRCPSDGSYQDTRYFETDPNHGLFCRPDKVQHVSINGMRSQRNSLDINLRTSVTGIVLHCEVERFNTFNSLQNVHREFQVRQKKISLLEEVLALVIE